MIPKSFLYRRFLAVVDKFKAEVEGISGLLAVLSDFDPDSEAKGPSSVLPTASAASQNVENQLLTQFVKRKGRGIRPGRRGRVFGRS
jgi:hypothetical protein